MGGAVLYSHYILQLPSFSTLTGSKLGNYQFFRSKEIADRPSVSTSSIKGGYAKTRISAIPKRYEPEDENRQSFEVRSSPNKEEILALFKRIQSSISKGENVNSKRTSKAAESKASAESMLEVLRQSRTQGKGKTLGKKEVDKSLSPQKDPPNKEERTEYTSTTPPVNVEREPSNFIKKSPIPAPSIPRDNVELKSETLPVLVEESEMQSKKYTEMKLTELKEVAKSKGVKGYSKLKKSELIELITRS